MTIHTGIRCKARQARALMVGTIVAKMAGKLGLGLAALVAGALMSTPADAASVFKVDTGDATTTTLAFRGEIRDGDLARLQALTAKVPSSQRIVLLLDSPGGSVDEGIAIGRYVYATKITTVAIQGPGCHSACTYVFLAGRDINTVQPSRIMMKGARLGFHQTRLSNLPNQTYTAEDINVASALGQDSIKKLDSYFKEIKADAEFLTLTLSAPNSTVALLNELDALRLGIYVMDPQTDKLLAPDQFKEQTAGRR